MTPDELCVIEKRLGRRMTLAHMAGAVAVFAWLRLSLENHGAPACQSGSGCSDVTDFIIFGVVIILGTPIVRFVCRRAMIRATAWVHDERPPTADERQRMLMLHWRHTVVAFAFWVFCALLWSLGAVAFFNSSARHAIAVGDGILLGGLATSAMGYLLAERTLRPLFVLALEGGEGATACAALGVRRRLFLTWALGSGIPLFALALTPWTIETDRWQLPVAILGFLGIATGALMMRIAAAAVTEPLDQLRDQMRIVEAGGTAAAVAVDDGGEVGLLQIGFNRMVAGLSEREKLQDLFGRHVGSEVARLAVERGVDLSGEQLDATVLFVDLIDSTSLVQDRPAHMVVSELNRFFACVVSVVTAEGGWVNKFEGDGALCVFGAPVAQPDHAARGLRAAAGLAESLAAAGPPLRAGIGVSSGAVVAGNVGTEDRYEFTVIGDAVHEAARLCEAAKAIGGVLASESAVASAGVEALHWRRGEEVQLRGRRTPTVTFAPEATSRVAPA